MTDRELLQRAMDALNGLLGWQSLAPHEDQENAKAVAFQLRARLSKCDRCGKVNPAEIHTCTPRESSCGECSKKASDGWALYCVECSKPMREWVGLTDEEIRQGNRRSWVTKQAWESAVWWAEAKLKEKNT